MTETDNKIKQYHLYKIYYAEIKNHEYLIYEMIKNHKLTYKKILDLQDYTLKDEIIIEDFKVTKSLLEEINNKKMNVCLLKKEGRAKQIFTIPEILQIIKITKLLENNNYDELNNFCINVVNNISDLVGINVNSNPSSNLKLNGVEEIIVSAPRAIKFKMILFNYLKISLLNERIIKIKGDDYRILNALNLCKIKKPKELNEFTLEISVNGTYFIDCVKIEKSFQKHLWQKRNKNT